MNLGLSAVLSVRRVTYEGCGLSHSTPSPAAPASWKYDGWCEKGPERRLHPVLSPRGFVSLYKLAWTQEARLLTELRCGRSLRLRGELQEGAGALPREPSLLCSGTVDP